MTLAEYRRGEHRLELWDAASRTAWMAREGPIREHEGPSQTLAEMAALIAAARGSPIECYGAMGLVRRYEAGTKRLVPHPDQTVYPHPSPVEQDFEDPLPAVGRSYPDMVLEADHTADVWRWKRGTYEARGFPEVRVEVPEGCSASRPAMTVPESTARTPHRPGAPRPGCSDGPGLRAGPGRFVVRWAAPC